MGPDAALRFLPWPEIMRFALSQLKWTPAAFWSATLCEVRAAAGIGHPAVLFSRQAMAQMMAAHPDLEPFKEHRT